MSLTRTCAVVAVLLALAGCQNNPAPATAPSADVQATAPAAQVTTPVPNPVISVDPPSMTSCDRMVATVHWDADKSDAATSTTEVWVGTSADNMKIFAAGGARGEAKTDNWTRPGVRFQLKNKADGKILGETVVTGPACS